MAAEVTTTQSPPRRRASRGTLIGGIVALVSFLLLLSLILVVGRQPGGPAATGAGRVGVVVAAKNLTARQVLGAGDVAVKQIYTADVPSGTFTHVEDVKGMMAAANLTAGQPITSGLVAKPGEDLGQSDVAYLPLPPGYVATTVPTSEQQGVAGYIRAGDSISVVAVVPTNPGQQSASANARTVLTNLHVLRVGVLTPKPSGGQPGQASAAPTLSSLTVMVTQCQAELLNWFLANAQVRYTLESYKDYQSPPAGADQTCSSVTSAQGITRADIARRYPGIFNQ
ncbi:MAG: Flp pilus assembly protein CpaB [Candidatus Dormibacteraeota bacterium]|nr:Flp pilus assembly protein CpaB [Candidatus Dormibacteraeota bacterium]